MALILVIDDSRTQRMAACMALQKAGHEFLQAEDGDEGLHLAQSDRPDLILCDVEMKGMDGFAFLERLRGDHSLPYIPVIMITSHAGRAEMRRAMTTGADDFLSKPFTFQEVQDAVSAVLTKRDSQRQDFTNSAIQEFEQSVQSEKDALGSEYEHRLTQAIHERWERLHETNREASFGAAAVVLVDTGAHETLKARGSPRRAAQARVMHQAAMEGLLSLGADRVVAFGRQWLAVFAPKPAGQAGADPLAAAVSTAVSAALCMQAEFRSLRDYEHSLVGDADKDADIDGGLAMAVALGDVSLLDVTDPLHGDAGTTLVTGAALFDAEEVLELAQSKGWALACSARMPPEALAQLPLGEAVGQPLADAGFVGGAASPDAAAGTARAYQVAPASSTAASNSA